MALKRQVLNLTANLQEMQQQSQAQQEELAKKKAERLQKEQEDKELEEKERKEKEEKEEQQVIEQGESEYSIWEEEDEEELEKKRRIAMDEESRAFREKYGPYTQVKEISRVGGTGQSQEGKKRGRKPKDWNRLEERPIQKSIHFDNETHRRINRVKNMLNEINDMKAQTTIEDIVFDAVVDWLNRNMPSIKKKYDEVVGE